MEKSFARLAGFEHEAEMLTGYDELATAVSEGQALSPEATYTYSVLKLHAQDDGVQVSGQEGFLDSVKRGATKVYEWIMALIRSIRDWLFGKPRQVAQEKQEEVIELAKTYDEITASPEAIASKPIEKIVEETPLPPVKQQKVKAAIARIPREDKVVIQEQMRTTSALDAEIDDRKLVKEMLQRLTTRLDAVKNNVDEISRIDPDANLSDELGIKYFLTIYGKGGVDNVTGFFRNGGAEGMLSISRKVLELSNDLEKNFADATKKLEKIAQDTKAGTDQAANRKASRGAAILKEMGEAAAKLRDFIMTLDSQLQITAAKIQTAAIRNALIKAMPEVSESSAKYMQQAMDELGM